ncbi:hypothetical protein DFH08DRAFT_799115 [Mycena albidolilacea]|uniref:Uncharacterized protein n=1 Tax=Mycena albidolilacea TaxID=1033008 RepID=A0AAD7AQ78_9AGAR|nr:hypothetical protein DFH08DRAFT_799115 [Mycena albidolilacea]
MPSEPTKAEAYILGGWDLGLCFSLFLQGVLCAQFAHYTSLNKRDSIWMRLFVAGLALMTTLKSLHSLVLMWIQNVTTFGDLETGSNLWHTHWLSKLTLILEAITAFYIQMFFCRRLWVISRNAYLVAVCTILFLAGLISSAIATFYIYTNATELMVIWVGVHLGVILCGDLVLTGSTIFYLPPHHVHPQLSTAGNTPGKWNLHLGETVTLTIKPQSAAPAALCALTNFAGHTVQITMKTRAPGLILLAFVTSMVLPYLYAWSAMWTLNSREGISVGSSHSETTQGQHQGNLEPMTKVETGHLDSSPESMV